MVAIVSRGPARLGAARHLARTHWVVFPFRGWRTRFSFWKSVWMASRAAEETRNARPHAVAL